MSGNGGGQASAAEEFISGSAATFQSLDDDGDGAAEDEDDIDDYVYEDEDEGEDEDFVPIQYAAACGPRANVRD